MKISAGCLLHRNRGGAIEALVVKPAGFGAKHGWSIPKGLVDAGENLEQAARRETREETGIEPGPLEPLGEIRYTKSAKTIHCFHGPAPAGIEPGGFPNLEVAEAIFLPLEEAKRVLHPEQRVFVDRLQEALTRSTK